jgi:pimeloyl-ACP methyl ester carboxylesterase
MKLFYRELGNGDPLLILHGLFGSSDNWQTLAKKFARKFRVFTIDLRNHGRSFHHDEFDYQVMMYDISEFVQNKKLEKISLLGHSMGGKLSMNYALHFPEKVKNLMVIDIAPRRYQILHDGIIRALKLLDLKLYEKREEVDEALSQMLQNFSIRQFLLKNLKRNKDGTFTWKINLDVIDRNIQNLVVEISADRPFKGKTLFIAGEKSDYIRPVDEEQILELFPEAEIRYLPNVGHWVHAQAPDLLYNTVMDFTNSI